MARIPRGLIIDQSRVGIYHCVQRCVRRAMLCGRDAASGKDYEHRKAWIRSRLEFLAGQFGIDVLGYSVLSNHFHVVLRNRPDIVRGWSDDEVARRWWNLFPMRKDGDRPAEPEEHELARLKADPDVLAELRRRLASISWLMRCLAEPIARRANREDGCTGRFFEGRYKCQRLLDESAVLACSVYVDLNPVRAGVAQTPEESQFTSVHDRVEGRKAERARQGEETRQTRQRLPEQVRRQARRQPAEPVCAEKAPDAWLSPVELDPRCDETLEKQPSARASNRGFLPLGLDAYLELVDWTGRQARADSCPPAADSGAAARIGRAVGGDGDAFRADVPPRGGPDGESFPRGRPARLPLARRRAQQPQDLRLSRHS